MWLELLEFLKSELEEKGMTCPIVIGAFHPNELGLTHNGDTCIQIMRGSEVKSQHQGLIDVTVYIEVWARHGAKDGLEGYQALARIEHQLMGVIYAIDKEVGRDGALELEFNDGQVLVSLEVTEVYSDGGAVRPFYGSSHTVKAVIHDSRYER